jgi:hypothetical protein
MADEEKQEAQGTEEGQPEEEQKQYSGEKIMCFVSKQMVPIEDTVELEVQEHKKVRVLPKYIKYDTKEAEA